MDTPSGKSHEITALLLLETVRFTNFVTRKEVHIQVKLRSRQLRIQDVGNAIKQRKKLKQLATADADHSISKNKTPLFPILCSLRKSSTKYRLIQYCSHQSFVPQVTFIINKASFRKHDRTSTSFETICPEFIHEQTS